MATEKKLEVQDDMDEKKASAAAKAPNDFVLLKRIERDIAQLSEAGLAYLHVMLGRGPKATTEE